MADDRLSFGSLFSGMGAFDFGLMNAGWGKPRFQVEWDGDAARVLEKHWPDTERHRDICGVDGTKLPKVDLIVGGWPCFPAGTLILIRGKGLIPIESVAVGDEAWTHMNRWRRVTSTMSRHADQTLTLKGGFHPGLVTTDEHPFWASKGRWKKSKPQAERRRGNWDETHFHDPEWVEAKDMEGRYWSTPILGGVEPIAPIPPLARMKDLQGSCSPPPAITEELMWLVGAWVGDGWLRRRAGREGVHGAVICTPRQWVEELKARIGAAGLRATLSPDRTSDKFIICNSAFGEWLASEFGEGADGKKLPEWLYYCEEKYRKAFLDGYIWTDGSEDALGGWRAATVSRRLAFGLSLLAHSLGWACSIDFTKRPPTTVIEGRTVNQKDSWTVIARHRRKQTSGFILGGHSFAKCRSVVRGGPAEVFNISVDEDESYVADGVVVHNCTDLSTAGKREGIHAERSGLFFELCRVIEEAKPRFLLWENVPGLLSGQTEEDEDAGGDEALRGVGGRGTGVAPGGPVQWMAAVLGELSRVGFGRGVWRVLDGQYFGVPQRRRRVFGLFARRGPGDGIRLADAEPWEDERRVLELLAEVLLERPRGGGDPQAGRGKGAGPAARPGRRPAATGRKRGGGGTGGGLFDGGEPGSGVTTPPAVPAVYGGNDTRGPRSVACTITAFQTTGRLDFETENFAVHAVPIQDCSTRDKAQNGAGVGAPGSPAYTLDSQGLQGVAVVGPLTTGATPNGHGQAGVNQQAAQAGHIVPQALPDTVGTLTGNKPGGGWRLGGDEAAAGHAIIQPIPILEAGARTGSSTSDPRAGIGAGAEGDPMFTLQACKQHAVGVQWRGRGMEMGGEVACSLRSGGDGHMGDHAGYVLAPAQEGFAEVGEGHQSYQPADVAASLRTSNGGGGTKANLIATPIDMRQASRGEKMTNNRAAGSSGGAPGVGAGEEGSPSPSLSESHPPAVVYSIGRDALDRSGEGAGGTAGERAGLCIDEGTTQTLKAKGPNAVAYTAALGFYTTDNGSGTIGDDLAPTLKVGTGLGIGGCVGVAHASADEVRFIHENQRGEITTPPIANSLTNGGGKAGQGYPCVSIPGPTLTVRRLTATECLRLQSMPDSWLDLDPPLSDSAKYRLCGNAGVSNVVEWIGRRLIAALAERGLS